MSICSFWTWSRNFNFGLGYRGLAPTQTLPMGHHEGHSEKLNLLGRRPLCSRTMSLTSSWGSSRIETFWAIPTIDDGMTLVGMNDSRNNQFCVPIIFHRSLQQLILWHPSFILSSFNSNQTQSNRTTLNCDWSLKYPNAVKKDVVDLQQLSWPLYWHVLVYHLSFDLI